MFFSLLKCTYSNNCLSLKQPRVWVLHVHAGMYQHSWNMQYLSFHHLKWGCCHEIWYVLSKCFCGTVDKKASITCMCFSKVPFQSWIRQDLTLNLSTVWNDKTFVKDTINCQSTDTDFSSINTISLILPKSLKHASSKWSRSLFYISSIHTWKGL